MSTTTLLTNLKAIAEEQDKYALLLQQQKQLVASKQEELLPELKQNIRAHNEVVRNIAKKFYLYYIRGGFHPFYEENLIPYEFSPKAAYEKNGEIWLVDAALNKEYPLSLLRNDPIASAQHARRKVRNYQSMQARIDEKDANEQIKRLTSEIKRLETELHTQQEKATIAKRVQTNRAKLIETKLTKK